MTSGAGRLVGPPWAIVGREPDIGLALKRVSGLADRIAAQVATTHGDAVVTPTDADWLALFDLVASIARWTGVDDRGAE